MAASDVSTHSLDRIGVTIARLPCANFQVAGVATLSTVMQSWSPRSLGFVGLPRSAKYAGLAHTTNLIEPMRGAIMLLSGRVQIRMEASMFSSTVLTTRSVNTRRRAISG